MVVQVLIVRARPLILLADAVHGELLASQKVREANGARCSLG